MTENNTTDQLDYHKQKKKEEMKQQVITFVLMIVFTIIAFAMVQSDLDALFVIPIILVLAAIQVGFQLYYFMHMSHKGHELPALMFYGGVFTAFLCIIALAVLVWW
ncbi:cytochrome c oxidase subunit IV [Gracilibacillus halophilus YIM-C55.5]|uniref:Cytochrome c oxidase subunit IV n=1 Tax=Gracilibacillus halophilus YIM-C55.5 TaxID=1308866 RepID=N4WZ91_9BACI|nr:cytochrome c oxidase subunit IVB [Gracilibacillus halophilus]ENH98356.1 cytochrome c oxidase subunit IV [Gracilibacillus halophilus YIM-C55.5]